MTTARYGHSFGNMAYCRSIQEPLAQRSRNKPAHRPPQTAILPITTPEVSAWTEHSWWWGKCTQTGTGVGAHQYICLFASQLLFLINWNTDQRFMLLCNQLSEINFLKYRLVHHLTLNLIQWLILWHFKATELSKTLKLLWRSENREGKRNEGGNNP